MSKKYYPEYGSVIHPVEKATRKLGGNGDSHDASYSQVLKSHDGYLPMLKSHAALHFDVFKGIVGFINLPFSFRWIDDKSRIGHFDIGYANLRQPHIFKRQI
jgi:hypothetical protein